MNCAILEEVPDFGLNCLVDESLDQVIFSLDVRLDFLVDFVVESWERAEESWSEVLDVLNQVEHVTATVPDSKPAHH